MIRLHDTLEREKREFVPLNRERITMYVCGPTVYGRAHIGNARPAVVFDTLARLIRHEFGEKSLVYARNVTDVDDKIIAAAEAEGVDPSVITARYEQHYLEDMGALGVQPPDIAPHATQEISAMIAMIERLIEHGNAYEAQSHVLFSVPSDPDYGVLSRRDRDAMVAGARVEVAPYKRDPADFVLWKPSPDGVIGWESPWGRGRPGWHVECSAMIERHLGETIDIHGGGLDLIFPHHENEIAQSRCAHGGKPLARYWVHNGFVDMGSEKMSKSLGNIVTPAELLAKGHRGETLRLALLSAHYRQPLPWTESLVAQAKATLRLALLSAHYRQPLPWTESLVAQAKATLNGLYRRVGDAEAGEVDDEVKDALSDDLNTPLAMARLGKLTDPRGLKASAQLLGILGETEAGWFGRTESISGQASINFTASGTLSNVLSAEVIEGRIAERTAAKKNRAFAAADRIRDELKADGIVLEDGPNGTTWRRE